MGELHYTGRKDGKRSTIRVARDERGLLLTFRRDGESIGVRLRDDQARELAKLLNEAADYEGAA